MNRLLSVREVSRFCGLHPNTLYKLIKRSEIPFIRKKGLGIRFRNEDLERWLDEHSSKIYPLLEPLLKVDLSLDVYDRLFLCKKGGIKVSPEGKTWHYPFGSVYLRLTKSGKERWHIYYRVEGKRFREVIKGAQSRADALKVLQIKVADAFRGKYGFKKDEKKIKFTDFAAAYVENYAKVNKRSWKDDVSAINAFKRYFKRFDLHEIGVLDIEKFKSGRLTEGVSRARINRNLMVLKKMFSLAVDWGYLKENPAKRVKRFPENSLKERILTREEEKSLLSACASHLQQVVLVALNTGMRRSEILSLRWDQVDLGKETIRVERTKSGRPRFIPINSLLLSVLDTLRRQNGQSEFVFPDSKTEKPIKNVKTSFKAACKKAQIKGLRFHDLRHTAASRMVEAGIDLVTVSKILGHSTIQMTMRYAHPTPENMRRAVEVLAQDELFRPNFVQFSSPTKICKQVSSSISTS